MTLRPRLWITEALLLLVSAAMTFGQELGHVSTFGSPGGSVQFLPGGYVQKSEEGMVERYSYGPTGFQRFSGKLSTEIEHWVSYDWGSVDHLNQLDRHDLDPEIRGFVPTGARIKKVLQIPQKDKKGTLTLVCYSMRSTVKNVGPDATDLFLAGIVDLESDSHKKAAYHKLWERKLQENADYGQLECQQLSSGQQLILLYSATVAGNSVDRTLDIYRLK